MDPNTPKTFNSVEDFYKFLQNKQISKKEIEDNILENYLAIATKNKTVTKAAAAVTAATAAAMVATRRQRQWQLRSCSGRVAVVEQQPQHLQQHSG